MSDPWRKNAMGHVTYRQLGSGEDAPGLNFVFAGGVRF
jgi:hypothetical protein